MEICKPENLIKALILRYLIVRDYLTHKKMDFRFLNYANQYILKDKT